MAALHLPIDDPYSLAPLGFSVVRDRIASLAATGLGRGRALSLRPLVAADAARAMLQKTREAVSLAASGKAPSFGGAEDVRDLIRHLASGGRPLDPAALAHIANSLRRGLEIRSHLVPLHDAAPLLAGLARALPDLSELVADLDRSIDPRGDIYENASPKLASAHAQRRALEAEVERVLQRVLSRAEVRKALNSPRPIYRNHRPALAVRVEFRHRVPGLLLDRSSTGSTVYIEPEEVVELGNQLAETGAVIDREVSVVLVELSRVVLARRDSILHFQELLADLEIEFAKAKYSTLFHCCIPEVTQTRRLRLSGARHPELLDLALRDEGRADAHDIVPIDIEIGDEFDLFLITGPNTGGKTVALKTAGLLAAMALSGIPVPAKQAEVPFFDAIFVDIGDEQEISQSLSTFSSHMVRVAHALKHATPESLILMDEVGAGTDPAEGAALGEAILEYYLSRGIRTIATTHLGKLKEIAFRHPRAENGTVEFDPETLRPRYRVIVGIPGSSHALAVARRVGVPGRIVEEAGSRLERADRRHDAVVDAIQNARIEADLARKRAEELERAAARRMETVEERERALAQRTETLAAEAQKTVEESLGRLRWLLKDRFDALIAGAPRPFDQRLRQVRSDVEGALASDPIEQRRRAFVERLKRDDIVYISRLRRRCPVRRVHHDRKIVTVMVGDVPTDVPFDEVTWYEVL